MHRRGFLKTMGLAVSALVANKVVGKQAAVFDANDPPFADINTDNATVQLKGYLNGKETWSQLVEVPTMMGPDGTLLVLPYPDELNILMDSTVYFTKLVASLPPYDVGVILIDRQPGRPHYLEKGDVLTLRSSKPGMLVLTQ